MKKIFNGLFCASLLTAAFIGNAQATLIAYEALPTATSDNTSWHNATGPILADDFSTSISGIVSRVDWWGTAATSTSWEITFHTDTGGGSPTLAVASQHFVIEAGNDEGNGIFSYSALWNPQDMFVTAGMDYWFSVANRDSGWNWANGAAATVGSESYDAVVSTGGSSSHIGPHFGPWSGTMDAAGPTPEDFAFRIHVVPEPATLTMMGLGLLGLLMRKRVVKAES